jgi:hypothetical protein
MLNVEGLCALQGQKLLRLVVVLEWCSGIARLHPMRQSSRVLTRKTKELDHEKLVTVILVPLSERHGE